MKINKIILAGIMSLALAGCSSSNQQEIDPIDLLDTANETTTSSDISETTTASDISEMTTVSETISETTTTAEVTTTETTTSETETVSETVTEAVEAVPDTELWASTYAELVFNKLKQDTGFIFYKDRFELRPTYDSYSSNGHPDSDIIFCDMNFDGVPELIAATHGATGFMEAAVYDLDGNELFEFYSSSEFGIYYINGNYYTAYGGVGYFGYDMVGEDEISVLVERNSPTEDKGWSASVYKNETLETKNENVTETDLEEIYEQYLGLTANDFVENVDDREFPISELKGKFENYYWGYLYVPDENYTVDDIKICFKEQLDKYVELYM